MRVDERDTAVLADGDVAPASTASQHQVVVLQPLGQLDRRVATAAGDLLAGGRRDQRELAVLELHVLLDRQVELLKTPAVLLLLSRAQTDVAAGELDVAILGRLCLGPDHRARRTRIRLAQLHFAEKDVLRVILGSFVGARGLLRSKLHGQIVDLLLLELPTRAVAECADLALLPHLVQFGRVDAEHFGSFFQIVVFLDHTDLPGPGAWDLRR